MASTRGFTFTTAMRVIDRIHHDTANFRSRAHPARTSGFTKRNILIFLFPTCPTVAIANHRNLANLTGRHSQLRIIAFFCNDLRKSAGRSNKLSTFSGTKFNIVNLRSERNIFDRQSISRQNIRFFAAQDHRVRLSIRPVRECNAFRRRDK